MVVFKHYVNRPTTRQVCTLYNLVDYLIQTLTQKNRRPPPPRLQPADTNYLLQRLFRLSFILPPFATYSSFGDGPLPRFSVQRAPQVLYFVDNRKYHYRPVTNSNSNQHHVGWPAKTEPAIRAPKTAVSLRFGLPKNRGFGSGFGNRPNTIILWYWKIVIASYYPVQYLQFKFTVITC